MSERKLRSLFYADLLRVVGLVAASCFLPIAFAWAEAPRLSLSLEAPVTPFHQPAVLTLVVEGGREDAIEVMGWPFEAEGLTMTALDASEEALAGDRKRFIRRFSLDALGPRDYRIPAPLVRLSSGEEVQGAPLFFRVRDLSEAEQQALAVLADITKPWEIRSDRTAIWPLLLLPAPILLAFLWWYFRRRAVAGAPPPLRSPWEKALQRLQALLERRYLEQGEVQRFYVDLSAILRYYIEERFALNAPEQTTPELVQEAFRSTKFSLEQQQMLEKFLRHCDRVKFARYRPTKEEARWGIETLKLFIRDTAIVLPDSEASGEDAA